jgi:hypothetical protein
MVLLHLPVEQKGVDLPVQGIVYADGGALGRRIPLGKLASRTGNATAVGK